MSTIPRASFWSPQSTPIEPPERLFDFDLQAGDRFTPQPKGAYITAWWMPFKLAWMATAEILEIGGDRLRWTEQYGFFAAEVDIERTGPFRARLRVRPSLFGVKLVRVPKSYDVVAADRNLIALRASRADMVSLGRQVDQAVQFHLRLPLGVAIHKTGDIL